MNNNEVNIKDLVDYISSLLNFEISGKLIYLDVVEELESIKDLGLFRKELKSRVANLNDDYKYLNGFQKFTKIIEDYRRLSLKPTEKEHDLINIFCEKLFSKLTEYFETVRFYSVPTKEKLLNLDMDNTKGGKDGKYFTDKEIEVYKKIGGTIELYRLSTQNKPSLQEQIKNIVLGLAKDKKAKALGFNNLNQKLLK